MTKKFSALISIGAEVGSSVRAAFGGLEGSMKRLNAQLSATSRNQGGIKKLSQSIEALGRNESRLKSATLELAALSSKIQSTANPSAKLTREFERQKMTVDRLSSTFTRGKESVAAMEGELRKAGVDTSRLTQEMARLDRQTARTKSMMAGLNMVKGSGLGGAITSLGGKIRSFGMQAAVAGTGAALSFKKLFIDPTAEFEKYGVMMDSVFQGNKEASKKALDWVSDFAYKTPLELSDSTEAFIKLKNFGIDPMNGSLQAITDQNAKFGGSAENLEGIVLALGQAWTKGKLHGDDIIQLINRGVPVWDLLSKKLKMSGKDLMELSSKGELGRNVIRLLIEEMGRTSKGASEAQSKTWNGTMSNMIDSWKKFAVLLMYSGPFDEMKRQLQSFLDKFNKMFKSGELKKIAEEWGRRIKNFIVWAVDFGKATYAVTKRIAEFVGGWKNLAIIVVGLKFAPLLLDVLKLGGALARVLGGVVRFAGGILGLDGGFAAIGARIAAFVAGLGPVGWAVAALVAIVGGAAILIWKNWDKLVAWWQGVWPSIEPSWNKLKSAAGELAAEVQKAIGPLWNWLSEKFAEFGEWIGKNLPGFIKMGLDNATWAVEAIIAYIKAVEDRFKAAGDFLSGFCDSVSKKFNDLFGSIKSVFSWNPIEAVQSAWTPALDWIKSKVDWVGEAGRKVGTFFGGGAKKDAPAQGGDAWHALDRDPQFPVRGGTSQNSSTTTNHVAPVFHIHAAQGQSEQSIASHVARKLRSVMPSGGALYDDDLVPA
jgi:tape measure domain-containing protein